MAVSFGQAVDGVHEIRCRRHHRETPPARCRLGHARLSNSRDWNRHEIARRPPCWITKGSNDHAGNAGL